MKKAFRKIHLWLSVPFGILITLICFSGAMLVFEKEVTQWVRPQVFNVDPQGRQPLSMDEVVSRVSATLPADVRVMGVTVFDDPQKAWQLTLSKPSRASVYANPYTGEVTGRSERLPFFYTMFRLHRWLLDSRPSGDGVFWGKMVVGVSTLMFVVVLVSGIVIWWPRTKRALKNGLSIAVRKGWRRFWYDLHVAGGMYGLLLLLVMALTGLTWSFDWYRTGFYHAFGVEVKPSMGHSNAALNARQHDGGKKHRGAKDEDGRTDERLTHWQVVYDRLRQENPGASQISIADGAASVTVNHFGNVRGVDRYKFNPRTGEVTESTLYKDLDNSAKIRGWIYSVHAGSWGGWLTRVLWFLAALLGASLPLTGYYLWLKRLSAKKRQSGSRNELPA